MAGVDLVSVKELLGHQDIQTTMRYSHLSPGHLREAVNRGSLHTIGRTIPADEPAPHLSLDDSPAHFQLGTGSKTGSDAPALVSPLPRVDHQVFVLTDETARIVEETSERSSQFKNLKSKQALIMGFLDKAYPHC